MLGNSEYPQNFFLTAELNETRKLRMALRRSFVVIKEHNLMISE